MKKGDRDRVSKTLPLLASSLLFLRKKWNFEGKTFPKKRKTMRNEMNIKYMTEKRIYIMSIQEQTAGLYEIRMCTGFPGLEKTGEIRKALAFYFCRDSFGSYRASGRWTNRKTIRQTLSKPILKSRKYNTCFCIIFPKKKMNNT